MSLNTCANSKGDELPLVLLIDCPLRNHLCGFDLNFTYPQTGGHFPTLELPPVADSARAASSGQRYRKHLSKSSLKALTKAADKAKRDGSLNRRAITLNGTIDPWYGCDLWSMMYEYAGDFSMPWSEIACTSYYERPGDGLTLSACRRARREL